MHSKRKFDFVRSSRKFMIASALITLLGIVAVSLFGMNYGIDFSSGTAMDISSSQVIDRQKTADFLDSRNLGEYTLTTAEERTSIRFKEALTEDQEKSIKADYAAQIDKDASFEINIVDVDIAKEQQRSALIGMAVACLGILIYIAFRFEWRFGLSAVISLVYCAFFVIAVFSIFQLEVNLPFILAILTIIGYTLNDTVVIFDRIRENLRFAKIKAPSDLDVLVNKSIWQTLARSINTVVTVLIAATCLFLLAGESLRMFSLAMILGLVSGAYSSIFIASQIWLILKKREPIKKAAPKASSAT